MIESLDNITIFNKNVLCQFYDDEVVFASRIIHIIKVQSSQTTTKVSKFMRFQLRSMNRIWLKQSNIKRKRKPLNWRTSNDTFLCKCLYCLNIIKIIKICPCGELPNFTKMAKKGLILAKRGYLRVEARYGRGDDRPLPPWTPPQRGRP